MRVFTMEDAKAMKADLVAKYQKQVSSKEQQLKADAKRANLMSAMVRRKEPTTVSASRPAKSVVSSGEAGSSRVTFKRPPEDSNKRKCER